MDLSIVIVNYNVRYFLEQCLHAVTRALTGIEGEVIVLDNLSADGSVPYLQSRFPAVHFVSNALNKGFAAASNQGLAAARGRYILFLNPDTIIAEDSLVSALRFFREHPDCGGLGVAMVDGSGRFLPESKRTLPSPLHSFFQLAGISRLFPRSSFFSGYYATYVSDQGWGRVEVLSGAFLMAEKKLLEQLGGFDESFFLYGEDIDLSYRIMKAGYNNYYDGRSPIIHFKGESSHRKTFKHIRDFFGAMRIFVRKHYHPVLTLFMIPAIGVAQWLSRLGILFSRHHAEIGTRDRLMVYSVGSRSDWDDFKKLSVGSDLLLEPLACLDMEHAARQIEETVDKRKDRALLFNSGTIQVKEIIAFIMKYPARMHYLFRIKGSEGAVGSHSRSRRGIIIHG